MAYGWMDFDRARRRLQKDRDILIIDLNRLENRGSFQDAACELQAARDLIQRCSIQIDSKASDVEGAWASLHGARRYSLFGLRPEELAAKRTVLLLEKDKLSNWRRDAIKKLLESEAVTAVKLAEAMCLFDEYNANQYHKIWLAADQLGILIWVSGAALGFLTPLFILVHSSWSDAREDAWTVAAWSWTAISAVLVFGLEGGAFSVAQSLFPGMSSDKVPDRVANHWTMLIRAFFGSIAGMAGYTFYQANILNVKNVVGASLAKGLSIAFIFGFTGEKLISRVAASFAPGRADAK